MESVKSMDVFSSREIHVSFDQQRLLSLVGNVIVMSENDKGTFFKYPLCRILFGHRNCDLKAGLVLVEKIIFKEKYGFVIGKNIKLKTSFTEDEYIRFLGLGYTEFYKNALKGMPDFLYMYKLRDSEDTAYGVDEEGNIRKVLPNSHISLKDPYLFRVDKEFEKFKNKYFLFEGDTSDGMYKDVSIIPFSSFYEVRRDFGFWKDYIEDSDFQLRRMNTRSLHTLDFETVREKLEDNRNFNLGRVKFLLEERIREICKRLPRDKFKDVGPMVREIKKYLV